MSELARLKARVERVTGPLDWHDERHFSGSAWADGPDGMVSVMVEPPDGTPQVDGVDLELEPSDPFAPISAWVELTPTGAVWLKEPMPLEVCGTLFKSIGGLLRSLRWFVGDLMLKVDEWYGPEVVWQFIDDLGIPHNTARQYRRVAGKVPYGERHHDRWTGHQITCDLPKAQRLELMDQLVSGEIPGVEELREVKRQIAGDEVQWADPLPPCPKCDGKLTSTRCKACGFDFPQAVWWIVDLLKGG